MLPLHALLALDIANERSREAAALAAKRRTAELIADEAAEHGRSSSSSTPGRSRLAMAGLLHLVEGGAATVARSAGDAASRLDGSCA
jgi:hypothetical protein